MTRRLITTLLAITLALSGASGSLAAPRDEDLATTPEEEREARELLEEFNKKLVETNDIAPLIKEYFVPDFTQRLSQHAETLPFTAIDWKDETAPPAPGDLLRFYIASTNCLHMLLPLYGAALEKAKKERREDGNEKEPKLEAVLPPAAVELIKSDPLLGKAWDEIDGEDTQKPDDGVQATSGEGAPAEGANESAKDEGQNESDERWKIDDTEKLKRLTLVLEGVSKILREHLAAHPVRFEKKARAEGDEPEEKDEGVSFDPEKIKVFNNARLISSEFYGYPKGTRLVCADVGLLHVELVRVDGRLRILTIYVLMDD